MNNYYLICTIYVQTVLKIEYTNVYQQIKLYTDCSMNKQYVKEVQKLKKKTHLICIVDIAV